MLDGPLLVILLHPSIVVSGPVEAGCLLGLFCAFGRLLGVLRPLFAHGASFFPLRRVAGSVFIVRARCHLRGPLTGELRRIPLPRTPVDEGKKKGRGIASRPLLELAKRSYGPGGGPRNSTPCWAAMAAICCISASLGGASGWGGIVSALAGSPMSLRRSSKPAGDKMNNNLAGPESTVNAWGTSWGPKRNEPGCAFVVWSPT